MFIDASALIAVMTEEDDAATLFMRMDDADVRVVSAAVVWEVIVNLARNPDLSIQSARYELKIFLEEFDIQIVPIPPEAGFAAVDAFERFGKGRHPASLNFGDCLSYGCAKALSLPLLFKGNDFGLTDVNTV
ncbi:MAG: type II toxin-antitoxin system VapC family toxin [Hoeflea sp.]|uniref:type II toxin-antitoxin system VapC family toxin n=1 Tax=Hoeflea sp. TaxID=1940281 RepID=UPI001D92F58C|nr:type II toxin-antitoxin system VapC family toxin [Hoeflea sp.]MBU4527254.1 type II toxin-antitoxin system VapC family toxin [Alphaproteobacteria bacterium]MBU4546963.1 type II toxin-antitoxin system VapC family toxin [Alphaproteobacteria bacterium]MBU4551525.1 type II toxin-antitoxin system VapC family toxin [Alphaproteobacteria bacterium]MBV1725530.1 type II toxin-antitoxin system VapC family toxin [Hoeflea sp.]MBV1759578.1 type II toxin-antitoxin system VapC family toxin [Hoeflea sp.]